MPMACPISWRIVSFTSAGNADLSMMMLHACVSQPVKVPKIDFVSMLPMEMAMGMDGECLVGFKRLFHCFVAHSACLQIFGSHW